MINAKHKVFIHPLDSSNTHQIIINGMNWLNCASLLKNKTIFIKPNFTFPYFKPGVMTTPDTLEALLKVLSDMNCRIIFGEADSGGYNPFSMKGVYKEMQLYDMAKKYNARLVNLTHVPQKTHSFKYKRRQYSFDYADLFDEVDMTISIPVPKIHMNTGLSLSFKNLWGCISKPEHRLKLHHVFPHAVTEICKVCKLGITVIDGTYGLNRSGPMDGEVMNLGWLIISDNPGAACNVCAYLMGVDPFEFTLHLSYLKKLGLVPEMKEIETNQDLKDFICKEPFYLKRAFTDYPGLMAFHSRFLTYMAYFSPLADFLHRVLYLFRKPFYNYDNTNKTEI